MMLLAVAFSTDFRKKVLFFNPDQIRLFLGKKARSVYETWHCQIYLVRIPTFSLAERGPEPGSIVD